MKKLSLLSLIMFLVISFEAGAQNNMILQRADSLEEGDTYTFGIDTSYQSDTTDQYISGESDTTDESDFESFETDTVEVFVIDNYTLPEHKTQFVISFFTSLPATSKLVLENGKEVIISDQISDTHKDTINLAALNVKKKTSYFNIVVQDSLGRTYTSEKYDFEVADEVDIQGESNLLLLCLFGGTVFLLPSPVYANWNGTSYFGLTKEIPLVFLRSGGYSYPAGYFSFEYSYIFKAPVRSFIRFGYKHIIEIPGIEYISPGITAVSNLYGYNGFSTELSFGLFKVFDVFTVYTKFRYTVKPGDNKSEIKDISLGLYSGFFAIYF